MKKIFLCIKIEKMKEELKMKSDFYKEMKTKKRENSSFNNKCLINLWNSKNIIL